MHKFTFYKYLPDFVQIKVSKHIKKLLLWYQIINLKKEIFNDLNDKKAYQQITLIQHNLNLIKHDQEVAKRDKTLIINTSECKFGSYPQQLTDRSMKLG